MPINKFVSYEIKKFITAKKLACLILLFTITFNLWLYFPELTIKSDPNDNIFQFGLVNQVNRVWEEAKNLCPKKLSFGFCHLSFLMDHWVPNWAIGYPLPFYYSHLPQMAIVGSYRILRPIISLHVTRYTLHAHFNLVKYLVLCCLPLSFFIAAKNFGFSPLASSLAALFASQISTDGLYGIDPSSYLWRGYGLSSQLFAVFLLPLAVSWVYKGLIRVDKGKEGLSASWRSKEGIWKPILFLWLTAQAHLGIGIIAFISGAFFVFIDFKLSNIFRRLRRLATIYFPTLFLLFYNIIPFLYYNRYHNISFWDPIWKFESFGFQEVSRMFLDGALFDFGRLPLTTAIILIGLFFALLSKSFFSLGLLFVFWMLLFFGSKTWGPFIKMIPGFGGFHEHRFIVGVQLAGIFLAAVGAEKVISLISQTCLPAGKVSPIGKKAKTPAFLLSLCLLLFLLLPPTYHYAKLNTQWLASANQRFEQDWPDFEKLLGKLESLPKARVYAGRPGNWGKEFKIGDTPVYMALSVRGFPILGFLPETWSPNSDTEQFFNESQLAHYDLYNIRFVVAPDEITFPEFVKPLEKFGKFNLYQIPTSDYFGLGTPNISVFAKKQDFANLVHLWQISPLVKEQSFPTLSLSDPGSELYPRSGIVKMLNEVTYQAGDEEKTSNIFSRYPFFAPYSPPSGKIITEETSSQKYQARVKVDESCQNCLLVFKMTYHPNWQFVVDGKKASSQIVFPFFQGIEISPGEHELIALYQPNRLKMALLVFEFLGLSGFLFFHNKIGQI